MAGTVALWKQVVIAALITGGAGLAWTERDGLIQALGMADASEAQAAGRAVTETPVLVRPVSIVEDGVRMRVIGTGLARRSVMLRPETSGMIAGVSLRPGQTYAVGDELVHLTDRDQLLALRLAETRLAEAERIRDRFVRLEGSGAITGSRLDEVRTAAEIAGLELEQAREALAKRIIRAPFDGVAGLTEIEVGTWVDTDTLIASFDDRSVIEVEFDLPEALLARIRPGLGVTATTVALPGIDIAGTVASVDSRIQAESRTVAVRVELPNDDDLLRPGASFAVILDIPGNTYPAVPELAIQYDRGSPYVWRIQEGTAERVDVRLVRRLSGVVLVDGALTEGEEVVVEGTQRLRAGRAVRVLQAVGGGS